MQNELAKMNMILPMQDFSKSWICIAHELLNVHFIQFILYHNIPIRNKSVQIIFKKKVHTNFFVVCIAVQIVGRFEVFNCPLTESCKLIFIGIIGSSQM